jgi:diaminohydroxyphosphoribosylaminopyrimidine deaminase/5-amino-6-(5-phosphoribosylamino)uracil reductase
MPFSPFDESAMRRALELARRGEGRVEPNPLVGAVIAAADGTGRIIAEGWHDRFGGPHAEAAALAAAGPAARGATLYVTLEPCCHHGKTPPCTAAVIAAGITRVVVAAGDPFPAVRGGGIMALRAAGVAVETGLLEAEARRITAPFRALVEMGRPWVIAKWAMSRDRRAATPPGTDRWISSPESRALVHELRGRMDAILVGIGTAVADDPLLTARPPGPRTPLRIVLDSEARLPLDSAVVRSIADAPLLVAVGPAAPADRIAALRAAGCEAWQSAASTHVERLRDLFPELGRRRLTNLLVEGGPGVLRTAFAAGLVDEIWQFTAACDYSTHPAAATLPTIPAPPSFDVEHVSHPGGDELVRGVVRRGAGSSQDANRSPLTP